MSTALEPATINEGTAVCEAPVTALSDAPKPQNVATAFAPAASRRLSGIRYPVSEQCLELLDRLGIGRPQTAPTIHALGLTSCLNGEGVTTIACQVAAGAARHLHLKVALVDCHFSRPGIDRAFGASLSPGMQDALEDPSRLPELLRPSGLENLSLLTAGTVKEQVGAMCRFQGPNRLLDDLRDRFDLVVVDLPPASEGRSLSLGNLLDGVLLVVESERVRWEVAQHATATLEAAGVPLIGAVMNKRRQHLPRWLYRAL